MELNLKILETPVTIDCFKIEKDAYLYRKEMIDNQINNLEKARQECISKISKAYSEFLRLLPAIYIGLKDEVKPKLNDKDVS